MGKPFRLKGEGDRVANIGRAPDGKFTRITEQLDVVEQAKENNQRVPDVSRQVRTADMPLTAEPDTEGGDAVFEETHPWPDTEESATGGRLPMKVRSTD